jgi:hypothetical protein
LKFNGANRLPHLVHMSAGVPPPAMGSAANRAELLIGSVTASE